MKKALLAIFLSLFFFSSFAQKIHLIDSTNVWTYRYYFYSIGGVYGYNLSYRYYTGDTSIDGREYRKDNMGNFFREDTITNIVYVQQTYPSIPGYTGEHVLYNYNLHTGDTIYTPSKTWVKDMDSVKISGTWYKVWHYQGANYQYYVIEGLGCTDDISGVFDPVTPDRVYAINQLICFSNNAVQPALSSSVPSIGVGGAVSGTFNNTTSCTLSTKDDLATRQQHEIIPNPVDATSKLVFAEKVTGSLIIYNGVGQRVADLSLINQKDISIGDKINYPGIYYYRVEATGVSQVLSGNFVKQ